MIVFRIMTDHQQRTAVSIATLIIYSSAVVLNFFFFDLFFCDCSFLTFVSALFLSFFSAFLLSLPFAFHTLSGCHEKFGVNYSQNLEMGPFRSMMDIMGHLTTLFAPN